MPYVVVPMDHPLVEQDEADKRCPMITEDLCVAARMGHLGSAKKLLEAGISVEQEDKEGYRPLQHAAKMGHVTMAAYLLNHGARVHEQGVLGQTPIYLATIYDHRAMVDFLIQRDAELNTKNTKGDYKTALGRALCRNERSGKIDYLLKKNAHPCIALEDILNTEINKKNPFRLKNKAMVLALKMYGLDLAQRTEYKNSLLKEGACSGDTTFVQWLFEQGAVVTPGLGELHAAVETGSPDMIKELLVHHADVNEVNEQGQTPLHIAAKIGSTAAGVALMLAGAEVNNVDKELKTPLHYAATAANHESIVLLLYLGADCSKKDKKKRCPADVFVKSKDAAGSEKDEVALHALRNPIDFVLNQASCFEWIKERFPVEYPALEERHKEVQTYYERLAAKKDNEKCAQQ